MKLEELEHKLMSGLFTFQSLRKSGSKLMEVTYRTSVYYGEVKDLPDGRCHKEGKGVLLYDSSRIYEGSWKHNKREGLGFEKFENGNIYQGEFMMGRAHGRGVYVWENGETYDGEWYKGMRQGKGMWKGVNGESYDGEWRRGKAHGMGTHVWSNTDRYEGEWYRSLKHGKGKDFFHTGDTYEGEYRYGKFDGTGVFNWDKGMIYKGWFKQGMRHGKGQWLEDAEGSGASYNGEYYRDKKHGIGIYKWPSGNEYRGNYVNDKREGYGEMYWTDGSFYKGEWKDGIQHGKGTMTFSDGLVKEGQFVNNMYVDSKNYMANTIEQEDKNELMQKSIYSHMPRANFTAMDERDLSYQENQATHKRRYSNTDKFPYKNNLSSFHKNPNHYHSPEQNTTKFHIQQLNEARDNQLSYTAPYKKRLRSKYQSQTYDPNNNMKDENPTFLPNINSRHKIEQPEDNYEYSNMHNPQSRRHNQQNSAGEEYDSDYLGPRKPFMREDRSTSPPDNDPLFRRAHQRSVGIQEVNSQELVPKEPKSKSRSKSKPKKKTPQKIKFSKKFINKYPALFKGVKTKGGGCVKWQIQHKNKYWRY